MGALVTQLLQDLIRHDTVNPPGNERPAQEQLADLLDEAGFAVQLLGAEQERPNLVAALEGRDEGPTLGFLSHVDTVLADPEAWSRDPWSGDLVDGFVWGRGALDMKSQVAAEVAAAVELARERLAAGARRPEDPRGGRRGDRRGARRPVAVPAPPGRRPLRLPPQRGRRRRARVSRPSLLPGVLRGEGRVPLPRHHHRRRRPRVGADAGRQRAAEDGAGARAPARAAPVRLDRRTARAARRPGRGGRRRRCPRRAGRRASTTRPWPCSCRPCSASP